MKQETNSSPEKYKNSGLSQHGRSLVCLETESRSVVSDSLGPMHGLVHEILQARILEKVAFPFSRGSSQPRDPTQISCIVGRFFTS